MSGIGPNYPVDPTQKIFNDSGKDIQQDAIHQTLPSEKAPQPKQEGKTSDGTRVQPYQHVGPYAHVGTPAKVDRALHKIWRSIAKLPFNPD